MEIRPDSANLLENGIITIVSPEEVAIDDCILVKAGEKIETGVWYYMPTMEGFDHFDFCGTSSFCFIYV